MPWEVPITVNGLQYPVRFNTENEPSQADIDEAIGQIMSQRETDAASSRPVPGYLDQLGTALSIGGRQMVAGVKGTFNAMTGDDADTAEAMARMGVLQGEQQAAQTPEDIALNQDFDQNKAEYDQARGAWESAKALGGYVGSIASHPGAAFKQAVQSAPNAAISTGTSLAGYALGGLVGAAAGIETGPGAILTGLAGAGVGGAVSNSIMEAGPAIYDVLNERTNGAAASMTAEQISEVLKKDPTIVSEGLKTGAIRGSVIGVIEGLGMKGAGRIVTIPERAAARAAQKTLIGAGVDVASKEAVEQAMLNPALKTAVAAAAKEAKDQFTTPGNLTRLAGASALETGASGIGEIGAQVAAGQEINPTDAFQEMMGEVGMSAPTALVAKGVEARKYLLPVQAADSLIAAAEATSPDSSLATQAAKETNQLSADLTAANDSAQEAADFEESLRASEDENLFDLGLEAEQEKARQQQAYADAQQRQSQFESLNQNEQPIDPATGIPISTDGGAGVAIEPAIPDNGNLGEGILPEAQSDALGQDSQAQVASDANPAITELARQAAAINAGTEQGPNLNFPQVQPALAEQPITPQGAAPTGIATTTGQPMSGDSGISAMPKPKSTPKSFNKLASSPTLEGIQKQIAKFYAGEPKNLIPTDVPHNYAVVSPSGKILSTNVVETSRGFYFGAFPQPISPAAQKEPPLTPSGQVANEGGGPVTSNETEAGFQVQPPVATKETPQVEVSSADIESKALEILLQKRPNLSATVAAKAKKYFASRNSKDLEGVSTGLKTAINHSLQEADPQELYAQLAKDRADEARARKMEEDDRKADEEMAKRQAELSSKRSTAWDSVVGTPNGVEMNAVSEADGQESLALVHNSGDVPGVLNAFVGTSSQFLANPENETNFPDLWKILSAGRVDEGNFAYGRAFVFTDGIGVNASDRRNAGRLGVTPAVAAVRRVLVHESLVHRGIYGLPAHLQMQVLQWMRQNTTPEQLDNLARDYPQYENWRNNPQQMLGLCEEYLAKTVEKITKFPKDGPLSKLFDLLRDIWRWITGETGEPTVQNLRDVIKLLKAGVVAADARLVNGGKVDIKASNPSAKYALPSSDEYLKTNDIQGLEGDEPSSQYRRYANDYLNWRVRGTGFLNLVSPIYVGDVGGRMEAEGGPLQTRIGEDNRITIDIGNPIPSGFKGDQATAKKRIADAVDEEIIHAADQALISGSAIKSSRPAFANSINAELARAAERFRQMNERQAVDTPQQVTPQQIRGEIRAAYDRAIQGSGSVQAPIQQVFDEAKTQIPTLTEKQFGEQLQALYEDGSAFLVPADRSDTMMAAGEKWGVYDASGMPASYVGVMPSEVKASVASNIDIALHSTRGMTGKVDKIVNGLPANSYTGKPLQDAMSQSFAPLGSQQFYDETKSLIVKSIDDMIKRGVDSGDILATVIQPDFTEEAMKGWNESAKSVAKSIFFNHGLLLAVQKQEKLLNDGDVNAANKQQDKIDAWSKFWFNLTNNFGVTGNAIQRSMEDPAYQGLYLISNFKSQTKKNQQEVTDANIANPNEVAKDINEAGKKSKDGADNDVADALTGLQVDDEIAIGEAALTPENKTLWEETKNYLRTLARLTKARLKILAKNVKASNAAESADAEEARYVQMGLAGVDKLIAATQAKINKNFKKILGIPEAGKTRKPRTPKEEAAHPLIARMVARYATKLGAGTNLDAALAALLPQGPSYRDEIINDVVLGIVGRANRSIKKPKAPGTLTDLTKQLKKILSENIKVEPQSAPEESLGRKALRAFGFVTSNEQLVQEAWDKARAKVSDILREANLVETNESIEDKLNAILGEIPQQLYSTSQARSVIKDALEETKFDNTNEILSDVKGAREAALKSINDAVEKEGNVDPARWQRDQSYIIHAFDGLVADLQKAKDAGIAASNKTLRDAIFGADTQKALKIIIRKLTAARPGIDAPLAPALAWKRLFEMTQTDQGELKGRMFDLINGEPAFEGLSATDQQKLADVLEKAWDARRQQVLTNEFDRLRIKHRNRLTKKAAKVFDNRPAILKKIDSGVFDYDDLAALVGEEYGIKPLTAAENKRAKEISDRLSDDIPPHERMKLQNELQEMMVNKQLSLGEMLKAWWISAVLTGPRTAFTIGWSFLSGGYELMGHAATVLLNPKMSLTEKGDAIGDSIKNWWSSIGPEVRNAFMYVMTGDKTLRDPAALMQSAFFDNQFRKEMGRFSFSVAEKMITSKNRLVRYAGWFMTYGSRILNALDMFNFNITKAGSAPLVYSMLNNSYTAGSFQTSKLFKTARQKIINDEYGGTAPADTSRLNAWARNAAYQELSKITALAENMNQVARQSNFTLEPTGFGGWLYSGLKFADAFVQKKSEAFVTRMKQDLLRNGGSSFDKILVGVAEVIQAGAMQTLPILGLQFAKFALNKLNQTISFIPVAGLIRTKETGVEGQRVHEAMIYRNQAVGTLLFSFVYFTLKAIEDEPDDEKRGWGIEGGWSNLTPQEKRQRDAAGLKENTIWWRDKNGKRTVANFINWPISPILAAAGAMSDQIKYSPEQWQEGGVMKRGVTMGWAMGKSVSETSALSQFTELFGSSIASRDPVEAFANKAARVFGGYAGGYIPRIFKDIDRNMQPEIRKYEGWEYLGKELPYYRRYIGKEYLDIFGNVIAPSQTPWSREFVHQPDKPEYNMLSRVNSHGVWLSPAVAENRLVGKGSHKREMTDEEANRYVKIVGKGYSDLILKYGEKIISMPKDKAKKFVADKADDIRDRATKQAIQK